MTVFKFDSKIDAPDVLVGGQSVATDADLLAYELITHRGSANGYAPLDGSSKVPAVYLPSYVDDVLEFATLAAFPITGSTGIIYVADDTGKIYRWSGSSYVEISPSPGSTDVVPEGVTNLYFTNARAQSAVVIDSIADGDTTHAPSRNAVFDALALKADNTALASYILKAGDTMSGALFISSPANTANAAVTIDGTQTLTNKTVSAPILNSGATLTSGAIAMTGSATTSQKITSRVTGDTNDRFVINSDGRHEWGPGNAATDVNLYRSGVDLLATDDEFRSIRQSAGQTNFSASLTGDTFPRLRLLAGGGGGQIAFGAGGATAPDCFFNRLAPGALVVSATYLAAWESAAGSLAFTARASSDPGFNRLQILADGTHQWGTGAGAVDTTLSRTGVGLLNCANKLTSTQGLGVGNSAAATTLGSLSKKMEIFDAAGASLGFIPIYTTIT